MARGIGRQLLFRDDVVRDDFVRRLAALAETEAWSVYTWALVRSAGSWAAVRALRPDRPG